MANRRRISARRSNIHGRGVFALERIRPGSLIVEYMGERISSSEAHRRYGRRRERGHTMLFELSATTVLDATRGGNIARYINHSCRGNCRPIMVGDRIFIESTVNIQPGVELTYDYEIQRPGRTSAAVRAIYACRCGAKSCRGTMLGQRR